MVATPITTRQPGPASRLVNLLLAIKPLANLAKQRARAMMIARAERIGVPWRQRVAELQHLNWDERLAQVQDPHLTYPDYYLRPFHAYEQGNLSWEAALEVEVAAYAVHSGIWPEAGAQGDAQLRARYHQVLREQLPESPRCILDLGCGVGMSTVALQEAFPEAEVTGLDLSPYFLAVAQYRTEQHPAAPRWRHAAAEATGLPAASCDLVSAALMFHELPQAAAEQIVREARRVLRPGGHLALLDMNPRSPVYAQMPPYILTLLKSTEPYLDQYFALDFTATLPAAGFAAPQIVSVSPRHRAVVARAV